LAEASISVDAAILLIRGW